MTTDTTRTLAFALARAVAGHGAEPSGVRGRALSRQKEKEAFVASICDLGADAAEAAAILRLVETGALGPQGAVDRAAK